MKGTLSKIKDINKKKDYEANIAGTEKKLTALKAAKVTAKARKDKLQTEYNTAKTKYVTAQAEFTAVKNMWEDRVLAEKEEAKTKLETQLMDAEQRALELADQIAYEESATGW